MYNLEDVIAYLRPNSRWKSPTYPITLESIILIDGDPTDSDGNTIKPTEAEVETAKEELRAIDKANKE